MKYFPRNIFEWLYAALVLALLFLLLGGCSVAPSKLDAGWGHNSYPELGYPFGPANEEDTLDTLGLRVTWERGKCFAEVGLGYKLRDGGFYGDSDVVFTSRVGVVLWKR